MLTSFSFLSIVRLAEVVLNLIIYIFLARILSLADFGYLQFCLTILLVLQTISPLGINAGLGKVYSQHEFDNDTLISTLYFSRMIISLFLTFVFLLFGDFEIKSVIFFILFSESFRCITFTQYILDAEKQFEKSARLRLAAITIGFVVRIYFISTMQSLPYYALALCIEAIILFFIFYFFFIRKKFNLSINKIDIRIIYLLVSRYKFLFISGFMQILIIRSDMFYVKHYLGNEAVAGYSLIIRLSEMPASFALIATNIFYGTYLNMQSQKSNTLQYTKKFTLNFLLTILGISILILMIPESILQLVFTEKFNNFWLFLPYSSILFLILATRHYISKHIILQDTFYASFNINFIALILNLLFNYVGVFLFGLGGVLFATVLALSIAISAVCIFTHDGRTTTRSIIGRL